MDFCKNNQCSTRRCPCENALDMSQIMPESYSNCSESCEAPTLRNVALAMVYSPDHDFDCMYSPEDGLAAGTLFKGLDKPFYGRTVCGGAR